MEGDLCRIHTFVYMKAILILCSILVLFSCKETKFYGEEVDCENEYFNLARLELKAPNIGQLLMRVGLQVETDSLQMDYKFGSKDSLVLYVNRIASKRQAIEISKVIHEDKLADSLDLFLIRYSWPTDSICINHKKR